MRLACLLLLLIPTIVLAQSPFGGGGSPPTPDTSKPAEAPAPLQAHKAPREKSISVVLPMSKDKAADIVSTALLDAGYQIASTSPSLIQTAELERYGNTAGFVLRANVLGFAVGDSTRVALTATFFNDLALRLTRVLAGPVGAHDDHAGENQPVEHYTGGLQAKLWQRLDDAAAAIAKAGGGHRFVLDSTSAPR
jgi:hypothetical protein